MNKACLGLVLCVVNLLVLISPGFGATLEEKSSLHALPGIHVRSVDFTSVPSVLTNGLPLDQFREQIESQLRHGGIPIVPGSSNQNLDSLPFLSVQGALSQIAVNYYAYTVIVKLHQQATLSRGAHQPFVVTWSAGTLSTGQIDQISERIKFLVDRFISDYDQANLPKGRIQLKTSSGQDML